ncbi:heavy metal translocating P-type ATPase [Aquitalea aquatilis]|uniref:heavy metal translocating P-type ATPase n=1 Tax=Aquitalea aquatilis TaxID=1537400 RepID=UPI001FE34D62|nr:heavy metal translocating P-type ATPase [Aquitalea aquatilis]
MGKKQSLINAALLLPPTVAVLLWCVQRVFSLDVSVDIFLLVSAVPVMVLLVKDTVVALSKQALGVDLLALLAIGGSMMLDQWLTAAIIAAMAATGRWLDSYAAGRAEREMTSLLAKVPRYANRLEGESQQRVPLAEIAIGDFLLVKSGEVVPVDGRLKDPLAVLDEATLTGEPTPVNYNAGALLRSGTINAGDAFRMTAIATAEASTFSSIIKLVEEAGRAKAPVTRMADRYAFWFIPATLALAGLAWLASGDVMRALAVLVVATPCPLLLAVPVAMISGISQCASRGVLVKSGEVLETLARANLLFFDKTGTLTGGKARLTAIHAADGVHTDEVLRLAAALDQMSNHVMATAVVQAANERGETRLPMPSDVTETAGAGLTGLLENRRVALGNFAYITGQLSFLPEWATQLQSRLDIEGSSSVYVAREGQLLGALEMADCLRLETPRALRMLKRAGIKRITMLSGDRQDVAEAIGNGIGVDEVFAGLQPQDKLSHIQEARQHGVAIMVGDGINDAPALRTADVGVAMGAQGAAAAAESAGVVLLNDRLDRLAETVIAAHRTMSIARQSVVAGMGLSVTAMLAAAWGWLPPVAGAVLQEIIDVAVILNALRALAPPAAVRQRQRFTVGTISKLNEEHAQLNPLLQHLAALARSLPQLEHATLVEELTRLDAMLQEQLLPHEKREEHQVYPAMARLLGGEDPLAALSRSHQEIFKQSRRLAMQIAALPISASALEIQELQRTLYGLDTILQLHFAQEDELYLSMT